MRILLFLYFSLGTLYLWGNITTGILELKLQILAFYVKKFNLTVYYDTLAVTSYLQLYDSSVTSDQTLLVYATALGCQVSVISPFDAVYSHCNFTFSMYV